MFTNNNYVPFEKLDVIQHKQVYGQLCPVCNKQVGGRYVYNCVDPAHIIVQSDDEEGLKGWVFVHDKCWDKIDHDPKVIEKLYNDNRVRCAEYEAVE